MRSKILSITVATAVLAVAASASAQREVRQTERLVERANATLTQIVRVRAQLVTTVEIYNNLMGGGADSKKLFNDLRRAVDQTDDRRDDTRKAGENMEKEAHKFFEEWTKSLADIGSPEMRQRAQERLNETRLTYSNIMAAGREAGASFDVFMGGLRDQITYLGYDLNPGGIASLSADAERLNEQATAMFASIDAVITSITQYSASLRAQ